jgi:triosephosphate isomerase (TIM)
VSGAAARKPLIAGNWKMHCNHLEALALTQKLAFMLRPADFAAADIALLPPFTALRSVQTLVDADKLQVRYGAQDVSPHEDGAYTGEVSARMLAKLGCEYVLAGHSERRRYHAETDGLVSQKVASALRQGLTPVLCVGEPLPVRQAGDHLEYTLRQLDGSLAGLARRQLASMVIAYEPVWAIGTGEVATPADAQQVCGAIRDRLSGHDGGGAAAQVRILYGGSVKAGNMPAIMAQPDIDGALVGGASLDAAEFVAICRYRDIAVAAKQHARKDEGQK